MKAAVVVQKEKEIRNLLMPSTEEEEELTSSKLSREGEEGKRGSGGSVLAAGKEGTVVDSSLCKCKGRIAPTSLFHIPLEPT